MGSQPQRGERYEPPGFFVRHGIDVSLETVASTVSQVLYLAYTAEQHASVIVAGFSVAVIYVMREHDNGRRIGLTKATLAAFNACVLVEMVTTFQSAPMATGELMMLAGINYLVLSRFALRGGGAPAS